MEDKSTLPTLKLADVPNATPSEKLAWEKELLGLYISGHPLDKYRTLIDSRDMNIKKAKETLKEGAITVIAGIVEEIKQVVTKKGDQMLFVKFADFTGSMETVVFPKTYIELKSLFVVDRCLAIKGKISERNGAISMLVEKAKPLT